VAKVIWTEESRRWLAAIFDYIARDNPPAAERTIDGVLEKAELLVRFPQLGYLYRDSLRGEIRITLYGHYRITYLIRSDGAIEVLGVFHAALDLDRYLSSGPGM
jgi:toxin ParE1/3/4